MTNPTFSPVEQAHLRISQLSTELAELREARVQEAVVIGVLVSALNKAEIGLLSCAPLPGLGFDYDTLHSIRAALAKASSLTQKVGAL